MTNIVDPVEVRKTIIEILFKSKASHLGTNMSAVESLISIYSSIDINDILSNSINRSRVFVSKGHCSAATCSVLYHFGIIKKSVLETYHLDDSYLAGHVSHGVQGIEHSTGALGHGLSVALGCAIGMRSVNNKNLVLTLCGDGEIQEGSIWEAIMFAQHKKIQNFVIIIDNNKISSITDTHKVIDMRPIKKRFEGFGMQAFDVDGHNTEEITLAIDKIKHSKLPGVIIADTKKGKDIPFAENEPIWHYRNLDVEHYEKALHHLNSL